MTISHEPERLTLNQTANTIVNLGIVPETLESGITYVALTAARLADDGANIARAVTGTGKAYQPDRDDLFSDFIKNTIFSDDEPAHHPSGELKPAESGHMPHIFARVRIPNLRRGQTIRVNARITVPRRTVGRVDYDRTGPGGTDYGWAIKDSATTTAALASQPTRLLINYGMSKIERYQIAFDRHPLKTQVTLIGLNHFLNNRKVAELQSPIGIPNDVDRQLGRRFDQLFFHAEQLRPFLGPEESGTTPLMSVEDLFARTHDLNQTALAHTSKNFGAEHRLARPLSAASSELRFPRLRLTDLANLQVVENIHHPSGAYITYTDTTSRVYTIDIRPDASNEQVTYMGVSRIEPDHDTHRAGFKYTPTGITLVQLVTPTFTNKVKASEIAAPGINERAIELRRLWHEHVR